MNPKAEESPESPSKLLSAEAQLNFDNSPPKNPSNFPFRPVPIQVSTEETKLGEDKIDTESPLFKNLGLDPSKDLKDPDPATAVAMKNQAKEINALLNFDTYTDLDPTQSPHLLLVVHGIGARPDILYTNLLKVRNAINIVRKTKAGQFRAPIIIKMVDWKSALAIQAKEKIDKITLKTNKKQRIVMNEVPTDLFFYLTEDHCVGIINEVASQATYYYDKLSSKFPGLQVSILGHSLGSVIIYDLITQNKKRMFPDRIKTIDFPIENIFIIGSPLGLFVSMTPIEFQLLDRAGFCKGFYNVFHPNDLIAYRIEPLINGYPDLAPDEIPYMKNDGYKTHTTKKKMDQKIKDLQGLAKLDESAIIASLTRYDYVLQEGLLENMFETIGLLGGHWGYWESKDLFYFILKKMHTKRREGSGVIANL